jgi:hypothetical protein
MSQITTYGREPFFAFERGSMLFVAGAVLPGHAAGAPFTDPQHTLEVDVRGLEVSLRDLLERGLLQTRHQPEDA